MPCNYIESKSSALSRFRYSLIRRNSSPSLCISHPPPSLHLFTFSCMCGEGGVAFHTSSQAHLIQPVDLSSCCSSRFPYSVAFDLSSYLGVLCFLSFHFHCTLSLTYTVLALTSVYIYLFIWVFSHWLRCVLPVHPFACVFCFRFGLCSAASPLPLPVSVRGRESLKHTQYTYTCGRAEGAKYYFWKAVCILIGTARRK